MALILRSESSLQVVLNFASTFPISIQASSNTEEWFSLATNIFGNGVTVQYQHTNPPADPILIYRATTP